MALYALSAVYFAGVMVRLMLTLTPVVCVLSGIAFSILLDLVLREDELPAPQVDTEESKSLYDKVRETARNNINITLFNYCYAADTKPAGAGRRRVSIDKHSK